jgi:hypothetical protein
MVVAIVTATAIATVAAPLVPVAMNPTQVLAAEAQDAAAGEAEVSAMMLQVKQGKSCSTIATYESEMAEWLI